MPLRSFTLLLLAVLVSCAAPALADDFPQFHVPGFEAEMQSLNDLHRLHSDRKTTCTLWDAWLPGSSVWPAVGIDGEESADAMRAYYKRSLSRRVIDSDGYVSMNQHRGLAHPAGWPFPTWPQARGAGWHFTHAGDGYARMLRVPLATAKGFTFEGLGEPRVDSKAGLVLMPVGLTSTISTPPCRVDTFVAPFVTIEWSRDAVDGDAWLEWTSEEFPEFDRSRRVAISHENARPGTRLTFSALPMHRHPLWRGTLTGLRVGWTNAANPKPVTLRSIHTAIDTRHPITNALFSRAVCDVFSWTRDTAFLSDNIERVRRALAFAIDEFAIEEQGCVRVPWVGHGGRTGFVRSEDGRKQLHYGRGVGNNYWDLLPCGHQDFLATLYLFDALQRVADSERVIERHPEWGIPAPPADISAAALSRHAGALREKSGELFWNEANGRFVLAIDVDGVAHDYGFTFANLEAIAYGFASDAQAKSILQWVSGDRVVAGDTSQGDDIYHWRFAPRATTKRNVEWYAWVWHGPESIPWGGQVQDGGAVLGFSYHDMLARLRMNGPDDAWQRLRPILTWFREVQAEGGYRAYYDKPGRGTLQGGGKAGGLGVDKEFMESILVPQIMLDGFLGLKPTPDGLQIDPKLPEAWPSLTVTRIHIHDHVVDVRATQTSIEVKTRRGGAAPLSVQLPDGDARDVRFVSDWSQ